MLLSEMISAQEIVLTDYEREQLEGSLAQKLGYIRWRRETSVHYDKIDVGVRHQPEGGYVATLEYNNGLNGFRFITDPERTEALAVVGATIMLISALESRARPLVYKQYTTATGLIDEDHW